jgi:cytochrome c oxidase accessory protein FixG
MTSPRRHLPVIEMPSSLRSDGSRAFVYPADVKGRFTRARRMVFAILMTLYVALPWVRVRGRPAVFLDIEHREFDLFGATLNAQDVALLFFLVTGGVFALVFLTAIAGRVFCGFACPQTVFLEGIYRRIERLVEGPREERIRRDNGPVSLRVLARKVVKHSLFVAASLVLAHVFVSYFVSLPRLYAMVRTAPSGHPQAFAWTFGITALLYANFAHFREQLCLGVCPYGRLQASLTDDDSLVVGYDAKRGEPRGKARDANAGDCVDCGRCVAVCPTGIDIRRGLQLDCVGCTACIDACDTIMDNLDRPRGLIRYDSLNHFEGRKGRFLRPRLAVYAVLGAIGAVAVLLATRGHNDFEANLLRLPGAPYVVEGDAIRNAFVLHLVNKRGTRATLVVEPAPPRGVTVVAPLDRISLGSLETAEAPLFVTVSPTQFRGDFDVPIRVRIEGDGPAAAKTLNAPFLGPSSGTSAP